MIVYGTTPWGAHYELAAGHALDADGTRWEAYARVGTPFDYEPYVIYSRRGGWYVRRPMTDDERRRSDRDAEGYARFMYSAAESWKGLTDAITAALARRESPATAAVWQTGGMCLAIGWSLGGDAYAMLTGPDVLGPDRSLETEPGVTLGVYVDDDDDGTESFEFTEAFTLADTTRDAELGETFVARARELLAMRRAQETT